MKLSVKSLVIAAALLKALCFLFVSLLNLILPPYGGALLALLSSLYLGYDPTAGPISLLVGTFYSLIAGAVAGGFFGWLYNSLCRKLLKQGMGHVMGAECDPCEASNIHMRYRAELAVGDVFVTVYNFHFPRSLSRSRFFPDY